MTSYRDDLNHDFFNDIDNILNIVSATGELFISMHLFDLKENKMIAIKSNERISRLSEYYTDAQDIVTFLMESLSVPDTLNQIKEFTTLETLPDRLKDNKMISQLFKGRYLGWCNTMFIKLDNSESLRYVLCIVQNVDKDIKKIEELKRTARENSKLHSIVDGLMSEYTTVCSVNLKNEHVEFLRESDRSEYVLGNYKTKPNYQELINFYIEHGIYDKDREATREFFTIENLKNTEEGTAKSLVYRNEFGEYGETKLMRTGNNYVLIGFTEKKKEIEEMRRVLFTDSLAGVNNRKYYDEELINQTYQGLAMADLDHFKNINDTYGHQAGDEVIAKVGNALKSCVRKTDKVIRYGGDEFILAFSNISQEDLSKVLEKIRKVIETLKIDNYPDIKLTMSFGGVHGDASVDKMISSADNALYMSKETRNTVTVIPYEEKKALKLRRQIIKEKI